MIEIPKKEPLNIVPFIDIMLVLLAMVLSISTFIAKGEIPIDLPKANSASAPSANAAPALLQIDAAGDIFWNDEKYKLERLDDVVRNLKPEERVLLRIDKAATFDRFIQVIDLFKTHGHENFTIAAEKAQ